MTVGGTPSIARPFEAASGIALPPGFTIRHLRRPADYPAMNRIVNDFRAHIGDEWTTTDEQFGSFYDAGGRFDPDRDVAIVELDGRIVAYGRCARNEEVAGLVVYELNTILDLDPVPIYPVLLEVMERHARALAVGDTGPAVLQSFGGDTAPELERLIRAAGYEPVRHGYSMVRPHLDDLPDAPLPEGLEIREVQPEHLRAIYDAANEAFRDQWGASEPTDEDWDHFLHDPVESDTTLWRIAWDGDQVAGQVRSYIDPNENERYQRLRGHTEHISVGRAWRRRGLARALIAASFPLLRARGMTEAALGVDIQNESGALRVYERCGFVPVSRSTTFRKPLD